MDQNLKKKIVIVKGFIQKKEYKQALDQLEVLMYKYQKAYQVHLMSGLCYDKIGKQEQALNCYKQVIDLKEDEPNAIKALCEIYSKKGDNKNATIFLQKNVEILKKVDDIKYREGLIKLVEIYRKDEALQKIHNIFMEYVQKEDKIGQDFVAIGDAYFRVSVNCKSFNLQKFQMMGFQGQQPRPVVINARQKLNILLIDIVNYLVAVSKEFKLTQKDIANSLYEMKYYFPYAPCMLMLLLLDEYCVGQVVFSNIILEEIYKFLCSYYKKQDNGYINLEFTEPEIFTVCIVLSYEYLAFFKEFFSLDASFNEFFQQLSLKQQDFLKGYKVREDYSKKINNFILKKCRHLNKISQNKNVQNQIEDMKKRIQLLDGSYLEEVIAKIGMNCFVNYQKLDDMKNMLKIRIKNLQQGDMVPHLYKYYVEYLIKIAKIYKILDQEINIYESLEYINKYDPVDVKFLIEGYWLNFSKAMLLENEEDKTKIALEQANNINAVIQQATGELKANSLRRLAVMKIFSGDFDVQSELKNALSIDRSFGNLQCMGFYCFHLKRYEQALNYLKEAFILNQSHYHTNRLIFILLFKLGFKNQSIDFVERIKEGFRSVFWINYVLALKYINLKRFTQAEAYLNASIESYSAGNQKKYKFSYEKTVPHDQFAFLYMIQQNEVSILFDEIIFPEQVIYDELKMVSSLHFELETKRTQIKLFSQMGEVLKILGRTKSALNYLAEAFKISEELTEEQQTQPGQRFQLCVLQKEYATLLFYMQMFRECEIVIISAYNLCQIELQNEQNDQKRKLLETMESQIDSLSFEVGVQRLSIMSKFESYQTVQGYLERVTVRQPKNPTVNFFKAKYQFYILEYLHTRKQIIKIEQSIEQYLNHFSLSINSINSAEFQNKYFQLDYDQKLMVKETLEDYFVIKYISEPSHLSQKQIMPFIQLFPRSTIFYIIFGMSTSDIKLKTAAFLKCIQLDKESPISIDLLASLYLKQKNYLAATKLFLKSLEMNILSSKCYLGLSICLFCIIGKNISTKDQDVVSTIHKALVRINSYMEYLRTVDPSQNYHLLKFLKLLVNDEQTTNFQIKTVFQASKRNTKYKYKDTLIYELLEQATKEWKEHNIWQHEGQVKIVEEFATKFSENKKEIVNVQCLEIAHKVLENSCNQFKEVCRNIYETKQNEFLVKEVQKIVNQVCIAVNLALKTKFSSQFFNKVMKLLQELNEKCHASIFVSEQNISLIIKLKSYLFEYSLINNQFQSIKQYIKSTFQEIQTYDYLIKYPHFITKFQNELFREVLRNPNNEQLKRIISNHMVVNAGKKLTKGKYDYKVELINNTHDNLLVKKETLKKLCILYRDLESYVGYIQMQWQEPNKRTQKNIEKWLGIIEKLGNNTQLDKSQAANKQIRQKIKALKTQIYSYYVLKFGQTEKVKKINLTFEKDQQNSIQVLSKLGNFYVEQSAQNLKKLKPLIMNKENQYVFLQLLSYITNKYQYNEKIQTVLIQLVEEVQKKEKKEDDKWFKGHLLLLRYLYVLYRPAKTEEELITQIIDLQKLIGACEQARINQNTISILKCSKCLISADYPTLQQQLINASKKKVITYSDQILINFFEIMRLYKEVETNPNKEGVIEEFVIYIEQMILLVKDPFYQGFFHSLKALVNAVIVPDEVFAHDRNLRMAMILSPYGTKVYLKGSE